jgi:hypothetical protein
MVVLLIALAIITMIVVRRLDQIIVLQKGQQSALDRIVASLEAGFEEAIQRRDRELRDLNGLDRLMAATGYGRDTDVT